MEGIVAFEAVRRSPSAVPGRCVQSASRVCCWLRHVRDCVPSGLGL